MKYSNPTSISSSLRAITVGAALLLAAPAGFAEDWTALHRQADAQHSAGHLAKALTTAKMAVETARKRSHSESEELAESLNLLGLIHMDRGDYDDAKEAFTSSRRINRKVLQGLVTLYEKARQHAKRKATQVELAKVRR